jgi:hypothetical protein
LTIKRTAGVVGAGAAGFGVTAGVCEPRPDGVTFCGSPRFHATKTRAVTAAIPSSVRRTTLDWTWTPRDGGGERRGLAGCSSSPTTKRELYSSTYSWPSSPRCSAYERRNPLT